MDDDEPPDQRNTSIENYKEFVDKDKISLERLKTKYNGHEVYQAGLPHFPRNFTRDSIISAILMNNPEMLKKQLIFCAANQGNKKDPYTGEEPGKIFHEFPGFELNNKSTKFNAGDTTPIWLKGHKFYQEQTGDFSLAEKQNKNIRNTCKYFISHTNKNNLFIEDPKFSEAEDFALKATYWKDSEILDRENGKPQYPIVYTLAHIQNMQGLRICAKLLSSKRLEKRAEAMAKALNNRLYDKKQGIYYMAIDAKGPIKGISSDSLHALFYLDPSDLSEEQLEGIIDSSKNLETKIGYRTLSPKEENRVKDKYHATTVWPFEQAIIHAGAKKFEEAGIHTGARKSGLKNIQEVCSRIEQYLDTNPETFTVDNEIKKGGCDPQLWTIAAKKYFKTIKKRNSL